VNILEIFSDAVTIYGDVSLDTAALEAGQTVPLPGRIQVGSVGGKPVYLVGSLTTILPSVPGL
jgi:hypothetical protein